MNPEESRILARLNRARQAYLSHDYDQAIEDYEWVEKQIFDDEENLPIIWIEMGWSHYHLGNYGNAISYFKKALESDRLTPEQRFDCLRLTGFSYGALKRPNLAIQFLKKAIAQPVDEALKKISYFELGKFYFTLGKFKQAKAPLEKAWRLFGDQEMDYKLVLAYYLGFIASLETKYQEANRFFDFIISRASTPKSRAPGFFGKAHLFYARKEYPALIDACEKILQLDPDFYDKETLGFFLCTGYLNLKMWDELEQFFTRLKSAYPRGRYKASYPVFEQAIEERKIPRPPDS